MSKGILRRMIDKIKEFAIVISTTGKLAVGRLKNGGWKGTMLALSGTVATFGTVLTACVTEPDVKIETITDKEKVESLVSENFSVENAVKDEMQKQFGKLENFTFENGVAKAVVTKDGEKYNAEVAINVDANDFKVEKYTNAKVADDGSLHFYLDGKLTSEKVDGIVVEVGKDTYVIDPTDLYNEISMAVSDASLKKVETEKPDPENPGGEDKPDPDEPENPGGEDKPDPDEPENPTDPENPDSQIETIDDINVIEQLLSQKDLTIEALAKAAATAFYGQGNVSNLSYQNGIVSGQAKTAEGTVNFSANLDLSATDFEGEFYAGAELSADGKTLSFYQNGTLATLTITEDMAVIETADGVNILDTAAAEQMVANKFETTNNETSVPSQDITFDSWQELMSAGGEPLKESINSIFQDTLFTDTIIKRMFGNDMTMANLNDGTIEILKWAFHIDGENITSVEVMGNRIGYPREASRWLQTATFTFNSPINLSSIAVSGVENPNISNSVSNIQDGITYYFDLQEFSEKCANSSYTAGFRHTVNDETLDETNQAYFDLYMPLAVDTGLIDANATLGFVSVQGRSGTNSEWGSTFNIAIIFVDISENKYYTLTFVFDDNRTSGTSIIDEINKAIESGNYSATIRSENTIISGNQIFEFEDALDGIVIYTISAENQK